jgi:hypothetical protein
MESSIKIKRNKKFVGSFISYKIILDGESAGYINNNKSISIMVNPGHHFLKLKVHPSSSPQIDFDINPGEEITFECGWNPAIRSYPSLGPWASEGIDDLILLKQCE